MQFVDQRGDDAACRGRIAPSEPSPVISAGARESGEFGLDGCPIEARGGDARFKNHGGAALPCLEKMQTHSPDIYQAARGPKLPPIASRSGRLIEQPRHRKKDYEQSDEKQHFQRRDSTALGLVLNSTSSRRVPVATHRGLEG